MGPCVTNWYFTSWSKAVSGAGVRTSSSSRCWGGSQLRLTCLSGPPVLGPVRPRRAEEGGGVPDPRRGQGGWRRRRLRGRQACGDEGL